MKNEILLWLMVVVIGFINMAQDCRQRETDRRLDRLEASR